MLRRGFRLFSKALLKGEAKPCGGLLSLFRQIDAVELDALVGLDEDVPDAAERARLDEIGPLGVDGDGHIRRLDNALFHVDQVPGVEHRAAAEGLVKLCAELHPLVL